MSEDTDKFYEPSARSKHTYQVKKFVASLRGAAVILKTDSYMNDIIITDGEKTEALRLSDEALISLLSVLEQWKVEDKKKWDRE